MAAIASLAATNKKRGESNMGKTPITEKRDHGKTAKAIYEPSAAPKMCRKSLFAVWFLRLN